MRNDKSSWASLTTDVNLAGSWRFSDKKKADKKISKKKSEGDKSTGQMLDDQINEEQEQDDESINLQDKHNCPDNHGLKLFMTTKGS